MTADMQLWSSRHEDDRYSIIRCGDAEIATMLDPGMARRIVACVNACKGISTKAIQADGPGGVSQALRQASLAVLALHKALEALTEWGRDHTSPTDTNSPHKLLIVATEALEATAQIVAGISDTSGPGWREGAAK